MALPKHKTTLSVLRSILGPGAGNEIRFAKKIGRSVSWLKKASSGQIHLTREAALVIAYETGVSMRWLLAGDTNKTPCDESGHEYTQETYATYRIQDREEINGEDKQDSTEEMVGLVVSMLTIFLAAVAKNRGGFFTFKMHETLDEMGEFFGYADDDIFQNQIASKVLKDALCQVAEVLPPSPARMAEIRSQAKQIKNADDETAERLIREWAAKAPKNVVIKNCGKYWEVEPAKTRAAEVPPKATKPTPRKKSPSRSRKKA